ncbi:MAG: hypothetical protein AAGH73_11740 [Pseudomonadota bacterium]
MSDFSLRLPYLVYLTVASILVGVLIAPLVRDVPPGDIMPAGHSGVAAMEGAVVQAHGHMHAHGEIEVDPVGAPQVSLAVEEDPTGGWNVRLETANFAFTPALVNGDHAPGTGHAHLYVDGVKVARLYGPYFHLPDLMPGAREISVSLSTNDHAYYMVGGAQIDARVTVMQGAEGTPQS